MGWSGPNWKDLENLEEKSEPSTYHQKIAKQPTSSFSEAKKEKDKVL